MHDGIYNQICSFIEANNENGTLFVLKGYSTKLFGVTPTDLGRIISKKWNRFLQLDTQTEHIISFEEFICLHDLLKYRYDKIYIIDNPLYHVLYPVYSSVDEQISNALLAHFDDESEENLDETGIEEYTEIFNNYYLTDNGIACCYNYDHTQEDNDKIIRKQFFALDPNTFDIYPEEIYQKCVNICDDIDYFELVQALYASRDVFAVAWESYYGGVSVIQDKIRLLLSVFPRRIVRYKPIDAGGFFVDEKVLTHFLKKYWHCDSYRNLKTYDLFALEKGEIKTCEISQKKIIFSLIEQVERCLQSEPFRDVFVTAPTGSGKSLLFQLPAMYIAEKYNLVTLVITPLIGLMNDQVNALTARGYKHARTINSDIPAIVKQEIIEDVISGDCHILYLSPESLLSRSDIEQIVGNRKIGMLVIDESHIVTTWGKQFRPDYWYLGDYVRKIRRTQAKRKQDPSSFIIATFTATAIYKGKEDMYHETLNSLHMIDPITYLGNIRRENIKIEIKNVPVKQNRTEYELNKFDTLIYTIGLALMRNQKILIYFPTVALIERSFAYISSINNLGKYLTKYHGRMAPSDKECNFHDFKDGRKMVMLATKAFGMGIDIKDISIVSHFAPTGNVCDYLQEIGRAARDSRINGFAIYAYMKNDFKHINRLHGLSAICKFQLVEVMKKILEIYNKSRLENSKQKITKKRNELLVDAENFSYIFDQSQTDENNLINKVKTAMLLIQKDYENRGFSPFYMRPIPLFSYGYFGISPLEQEEIKEKYGNVVEVVFKPLNICKIDLKRIWERNFEQDMSFPKFKYILYSNIKELGKGQNWNWEPATSIDIYFSDNYTAITKRILWAFKELTSKSIANGKYYSEKEIVDFLALKANISPIKSEIIVNVILSAMDIFKREYTYRMTSSLYKVQINRNGLTSYLFNTSSRDFYMWFDNHYEYILQNIQDQNKLYVKNENKLMLCKEITTVLGILESFGALRFKSLGGTNSQIYIYVNETKTMQMVSNQPQRYKNKLLDMINERHKESVKMLTYLFGNNFSSEEIWSHLENYFLGILPSDIDYKISV